MNRIQPSEPLTHWLEDNEPREGHSVLPETRQNLQKEKNNHGGKASPYINQNIDSNTDKQNIQNSKGQRQSVSMTPDVKSSRH